MRSIRYSSLSTCFSFFILFILLSGKVNAQVNPENPDSVAADTTTSNVGGKMNKGVMVIDADADSSYTESKKRKKEKGESKSMNIRVPALIRWKKKDEPYNPSVAWMRSLILPGWGQVYCRRIWKVPIIYAGLAGLGYGVYWSADQYRTYREFHKCALFMSDNDTTTFCVPTQKMLDEGFDSTLVSQYRVQRDEARRNLDRFVIFTSLWYALNILDAYVDAHLRDFNVNDDLSMKIKPGVQMNAMTGQLSVGMGVSLHLRNRKRK